MPYDNKSGAASTYAARGWALLAMRGKHLPRGKIESNLVRTAEAILATRWHTIGLACGEYSGTDVLDIDNRAGCPLDVEALAGATLAARTPSGGLHLFFQHAGRSTTHLPWGEWRSTNAAVALPRHRVESGSMICRWLMPLQR